MKETNRRIGIIGFGGFGKFLARGWSGVPGAEVTAIADLDPAVCPDGVEYFRTGRGLIESGLVDVVSLATPPSSHAEIAIEALKQGIHVLVEKPIAITIDDAKRLVEVERRSVCTATVDFMLRYNPIIECVQEWSRSRPFGPLQRVVVENYAQDEGLGRQHWFWNRENSGGIVIEHAVHFIDIVNGCTAASVREVSGRSWRREDGREDRVAFQVTYEDGLVASQYHSFDRINAFERTSQRFVFAGAQIDVDGWIPMKGRVVAMTGPDHEGILETLPNFKILSVDRLHATRNVPLAGISDQHQVDDVVEGVFEIKGTKEDAYLDVLRKLMGDFLQVSSGEAESMRVTLEDGLRSLEIAVEAAANM